MVRACTARYKNDAGLTALNSAILFMLPCEHANGDSLIAGSRFFYEGGTAASNVAL